MGILDTIRAATPETLANVRSDFDDLAPTRYRGSRIPEMVRIVEGTDDLVRPAAGGRGERRAASSMSMALASVRESTCLECNNLPCTCSTEGTVADRVVRRSEQLDRASDKQVGYIGYLIGQLEKIDPDGAAEAKSWTERQSFTGGRDGTASAWITRLKNRIEAVRTGKIVVSQPQTSADTKSVWIEWRKLAAELVKVGGPTGARFAVATEKGSDNDLAFWWVVRKDDPQSGRTRYFLRQVIGGQGPVRVRLAPEAMVSVAKKIKAAGPLEAMLTYGRELGSCGHCGRELTNKVSRDAGIGPHCRKNKGM